MMFVCPVCLFSIIYRLHRFCSSVPYVLITPVPYVFKNLCPSVPYVFNIFCLFVCGAKIILFIRIIVVSAYVFSIIN